MKTYRDIFFGGGLLLVCVTALFIFNRNSIAQADDQADDQIEHYMAACATAAPREAVRECESEEKCVNAPAGYLFDEQSLKKKCYKCGGKKNQGKKTCNARFKSYKNLAGIGYPKTLCYSAYAQSSKTRPGWSMCKYSIRKILADVN